MDQENYSLTDSNSNKQESAKLFAALFEQSPLPIQIFNQEGFCVLANNAWEKLWDVKRAELEGYNIRKDPQLEKKGILPLIEKAFHGEACSIPAMLYDPAEIGKPGRSRWVETFVYPLTEDGAGISGVVLSLRDVTEEKEFQEKLQESHNLLNSIIDGIADPVFVKDREGRYTLVNSAVTKLLGKNVNQIIGRLDSELFPPKIAALIAEKDRVVLSIGESCTYEIADLENKRHLITQSAPYRDSEGNIIGIVGIAHDLSKSEKIKAELREETRTLETLNQIGKMLSAELDIEKLVQAVTDAATRLTGARFGAFFYNVIDAKGESYTLYTLSGAPREFFSKFNMPRNTQLFGPTFRGEKVIRLNNVKKDERYGKNPPYYGMPEGHLPVTSYLAVPVISRSGKVHGGLFFGHPDEAVFKEREERIAVGLANQVAIAMDNAQLFQLVQRERDRAEAANRMKDEFLANISHELRTPLTAILGWSHLLSSRSLESTTIPRAVSSIERNAKLQSQLIDDLLDVSRIITGKLRLETKPVDLVRILSDTLDSLKPTAESKKIEVQLRLPDLPVVVMGDANRLQQIIWNILSNAVKFTDSKGRLDLRLKEVEGHAELSVIDTGKGIDPQFLPYVFDPFRQEDGSATRSHAGLGLGLSIVRQLVELHGGTVRAESEGRGKGSTFTVRIPLTSAPESANTNDRKPKRPENISLSGLKILIVDDDQDTREFLLTVLSGFQASVQTAGSAKEAFNILLRWHPDVLVSDLAMPGEDGYALIRKIRDQGMLEIPAIALTAFASEEEKIRTFEAGYQRHLAKPIDPLQLVAVIEALAHRAD